MFAAEYPFSPASLQEPPGSVGGCSDVYLAARVVEAVGYALGETRLEAVGTLLGDTWLTVFTTVLEQQLQGRRAPRYDALSRSILYGVPLLSLDEMLARVDAVTKDDQSELARELYAPAQLSAACIGPSERRFRAAVAPVNEALAAA